MAQRFSQDKYSPSPQVINERKIPERCKSQFISQSYPVSVERASEPLELKKLPEISEFLTPDELSFLDSTNINDLDESTQTIITNLQESEELAKTIADDINNLSVQLSTNHFLAAVPEFQPGFMKLEDVKARINVSKKFYKMPSSQIYNEIPTMFS